VKPWPATPGRASIDCFLAQDVAGTVEPRLPVAAIPRDPRVELVERLLTQRIEAPLRVARKLAVVRRAVILIAVDYRLNIVMKPSSGLGRRRA
jgi:hypothetical protein